MKRLTILFAFLLTLWFSSLGSAKAQTVEAVLRALQERQMVLHLRSSNYSPTPEVFTPIIWPGGIKPFPETGSIIDLSTAIAALNLASREFDRIKAQFVAYDVRRNQFINLRHVGVAGSKKQSGPDWISNGGKIYGSAFVTSTLDLPPVGDFDESNWRQKLRVLASHINQLKALSWPLWEEEATSYMGMDNSSSSLPVDKAESCPQWKLLFPDFIAAHPQSYYDQQTPMLNRAYAPSVALIQNRSPLSPSTGQGANAPKPRDPGSVFSWEVYGSIIDGPRNRLYGNENDRLASGNIWNEFTCGWDLRAAVGLKGQLAPFRPMPPVEGAPTLVGDMRLFKGPSVAAYGDLTEIVCSKSEGKLPIGRLSSVPFPQQSDGSFKAGNYPDSRGANTFREMSTALEQLFGWLDMKKPTIAGAFSPSQESAATWISAITKYTDRDGIVTNCTPYDLVLNLGPVHRRAYSGSAMGAPGPLPLEPHFKFAITAYAVMVPKFTAIEVSDSDGFSLDGSAPGEIETGMRLRDLVQIHLGRGINDYCQTAWLGTRSDGFGSLYFHGSPGEFEVLYENDSAKFGDSAIGGTVFDSVVDFTDSEKARSGWNNRYDYLCEWYSPRLKQVKGGDVLVTVDYKGSYRKELRFYWVKDAGSFDGSFYAPDATKAFKTIILSNPTAAEDGTALPTEKEHLRIVESGARYYEVRAKFATSEDKRDTYSFKIGASADAPSPYWQREVEVTYDDSWSISDPWKTTETTNGQSVVYSATYVLGEDPYHSELPALTSLVARAGARTRTADYVWHDPSGRNLKSITLSGEASWPDNGKKLEWSEDRTLETETEEIGGKVHVRQRSLIGNKLTTSFSLSGRAYLGQEKIYSSDFKKVNVSLGGKPAGTFEFDDYGKLFLATFPGGYREAYSSSCYSSGSHLNVTAGYGVGYSGGTVTYQQFDRLGAPAGYSICSSEGIVLAKALGSEFTEWGAPKTLEELRGQSSAKYEEKGINWGLPLLGTDPFKSQTGVSGYDVSGRPAGITTRYDTFTASYEDPLNPSFRASKELYVNLTLNGFGEPVTISGKAASGASYRWSPGGQSSVTINGREKSVAVDAFGIVNSVSTGAGSRGASFDFGVENGQLYTEVRPQTKAGVSRNYSVRTLYDQQGRPTRITRPSANGGTVTEKWIYDDANRTSTYIPGVGPRAQSVKRVLSEDGTTLVVSMDGSELLKYARSAENGGLSWVTYLKDDSTGESASGSWKEMKRTAVNPAGGSVAHTPWGNAANRTSYTEGAPGVTSTATIVSGATGDSLNVALAGGLPSAMQGSVGGVAVDLGSIAHSAGRLSSAAGTVGGKTVGLEIGPDGLLTHLWGPGINKTFAHAGQPGFTTTVTDNVQQTTETIAHDAVGDLVQSSGDGRLTLTASTVDTVTGSATTLNGSVTLQMNHLGSVAGKSYTGGLTESYGLNSDGTLSSINTQGQGGSISATVSESPYERKVAFGDMAITEKFYHAGPRSSVSAPGDARTFTYENLELKNETHQLGPWAGWTVTRTPDAKGRLGGIAVSGGAVSKQFSFGYDAYSRLNASNSSLAQAGYGRNAAGRLDTLTRGSLSTAWGYGAAGELASHSNARPGMNGFSYTFPNPDARHRLRNRVASVGTSWTSLAYDNADQLQGATLSNGRALAYNFDGRGNRNGQGAAVSHGVNALDQITARNLSVRSFGVFGVAALQSQLRVFHSFNTLTGESLVAEPQTGEFTGVWGVPGSWNAGTGGRVDVTMEAKLPGAGAQGSAAVAQEQMHLLVPPTNESISFDAAGRTEADAFWTYKWDGPGRLTDMTRKAEVLPAPNVTGETLHFDYDADGRRTRKLHTLFLPGNHIRTEESKVLWSGWLPILEERRKDGQLVDRRWFQWGADVSGTLEGAGGVGGLVAILEEKANGSTRTLLPVQDGLGNVTAVLDAADGRTVARYDYGPYGEPLGESGEADVCPLRYQTKFYDKESEFYYFGYRYYSPRLGRWISRDPLGEEGGINLYAYCGNDPINRHDPIGLKEVLGDSPGEFDVIIRPDGSFAVSGQRILQIGAGLLNAYDEVPNRAELAVINYEQTGDPRYLDEPSFRALAEVGFAHLAITGAHDPREMSEYLANTFGGFAAGGGRAPVATPTSNIAGSPIVRRTMGWRDVAESTPPEIPVGGRSSNWTGKQRFDPSGLSPTQLDSAILKSIRRKSGAVAASSGQIVANANQLEFILSKVTSWQRNVLAGNRQYAYYSQRGKGTLLHGNVADLIRQLNVRGVAVNQRLYGTSQFTSPSTRLPYAFRIPDYRLGSTILDIKSVGTPLSGPQVIDFMNFGNMRDVRFIFYDPW